ncbi:hypothetical protein O6H91_Y262500 [Diphasiastrum complanatum]|nr:hypothetical protein O6H91_Y262500 [Diphasiastrum complanatum]
MKPSMKFASHGVKLGSVEIDLPAMMGHKDKAVSVLTKGIEGLFKKNKVTYVKGAWQTCLFKRSLRGAFRRRNTDHKRKKHHHCNRLGCQIFARSAD